MKQKLFLYLALAQAVLITIISYFGLHYSPTYAGETPQWQAQCIGQDILNLYMVVPLLVVCGILAWRHSKLSLFLFGGLAAYNAYNFFIYCFAVHYNFLFLPYCFMLGLAVYSFIAFLLAFTGKDVKHWFDEKAPVKTVGAFLVATGVIFYLLWFSTDIPAAIHANIPKEVAQNNLFTNPVHVLDISLFLPCVIIAGISLMRKKPSGYILAPVMLVFCILMDITIAALALVMKQRGIESSLTVLWIMTGMAAVSATMLFLFFAHAEKEEHFTKFIVE